MIWPYHPDSCSTPATLGRVSREWSARPRELGLKPERGAGSSLGAEPRRRRIHRLPKAVVAAGHPALDGVTGRADPDISMDATDATSQASPTFAGILALATQVRDADLGMVNPA